MMMSQVAQALGVSLHGSDVLMTGVSKDSRDIRSGDLYVALTGDRFDGHQFIRNAGAAGAAGMLVSDLQSGQDLPDAPQVQVKDTRVALGQLAAYWCQHWRQQDKKQIGGELIAITGSNGKTSVKEMCNRILCEHVGESAVLATKGNLNNEIGMPITLLQLREQHLFAVIEMGANHSSEIDYLSNIAKPDVAIINNVGPAHLEGFGSLENIAKAKAEIFNGLSKDGIAVFNRDDVFATFWDDCCSGLKIVSFSMLDESASVFAKPLIENDRADNRYLITAGAEHAELRLKIPGRHNVMNALAAIAATWSLGLSLHSIVASLSDFENISGRLSIRSSVAGCQVIDDTYNANPLSVRAAIDVLAGMKAQATVLVLGDMAELGDDAASLHAEIGTLARDAGIDRLYATGEFSENTSDNFGEFGFHFKDKNSLVKALNEDLTGNETVLVKGSRSAAMEEVVERVLAHNNNKRVN